MPFCPYDTSISIPGAVMAEVMAEACVHLPCRVRKTRRPDRLALKELLEEACQLEVTLPEEQELETAVSNYTQWEVSTPASLAHTTQPSCSQAPVIAVHHCAHALIARCCVVWCGAHVQYLELQHTGTASTMTCSALRCQCGCHHLC